MTKIENDVIVHRRDAKDAEGKFFIAFRLSCPLKTPADTKDGKQLELFEKCLTHLIRSLFLRYHPA